MDDYWNYIQQFDLCYYYQLWLAIVTSLVYTGRNPYPTVSYQNSGSSNKNGIMHFHTVYSLLGCIVYCHFTTTCMDFPACGIKDSINCNISIFCNSNIENNSAIIFSCQYEAIFYLDFSVYIKFLINLN